MNLSVILIPSPVYFFVVPNILEPSQRLAFPLLSSKGRGGDLGLFLSVGGIEPESYKKSLEVILSI